MNSRAAPEQTNLWRALRMLPRDTVNVVIWNHYSCFLFICTWQQSVRLTNTTHSLRQTYSTVVSPLKQPFPVVCCINSTTAFRTTSFRQASAPKMQPDNQLLWHNCERVIVNSIFWSTSLLYPKHRTTSVLCTATGIWAERLW